MIKGFMSDGCNIYINLTIEPYEVYELIERVYPLVHPTLPSLKFTVDGYKRYEEDYGGFNAYGVLSFNETEFTQDEIGFIVNRVSKALESF